MLVAALVTNLRDLLRSALCHAAPAHALVLHDLRSPLARILAEGYRAALPEATHVDFYRETHEQILARIEALSPGDLVVLAESTRFDIRDFRFRLELFRRGLTVIEHPHLCRIHDDEIDTYVAALAYDAGYYRGTGRALKARIDAASRISVISAGATLTYDGPFEDAKLNVGDYTGMANIGGQFPIGEVFTEPRSLAACNGAVRIFAFGAGDFSVAFVEEPFLLEIEGGLVTGASGAPPAFHEVLASIRTVEIDVRVRELGFGLNRALTRERRVHDVGTYERMCGIHLSLGAKHAVYAKPGFSKKTGRFHVDVFADTREVVIDGARVFDGATYSV